MQRRDVFASIAATTVLATLPQGAHADFISAPDVVIFADPSVRAAVEAVGRQYQAKTRTPFRVLSAPGQGMVEQIARGARNDLLFTRAAPMDDAGARGLLKEGSRADGWRTHLVIAGRAGGPALETPGALPAALAAGKFAVTDPTPATDIDGADVLRRLGLADALASRLVGAATAADVCFLIETGVAAYGIVPLTDVLARPALAVAYGIPGSGAPPLAYTAAVTKNLLSREAEPFLAFLRGDTARATLQSHGLESAA